MGSSGAVGKCDVDCNGEFTKRNHADIVARLHSATPIDVFVGAAVASVKGFSVSSVTWWMSVEMIWTGVNGTSEKCP